MGLFNPFSGMMKNLGKGNGGMLGGLQGLTGNAPPTSGGPLAETSFLDQFKSRNSQAPTAPPTNTTAPKEFGERGGLADSLLPNFLKGGGEVGSAGLDWLKQAFANLQGQTGLNLQLSDIENRAQSRVDAVTAGSRFQGSPIGEALQGAILGQADRAKQTATAADQDKRFQQGLGLVGATQQAVTNPLLDVLGISEGTRNQKKQLEHQKSLQPQAWEKVLGGVTSILCWVAREIIPDRWEEARAYMVLEAPRSLFEKYAVHGESLSQNLTAEDRVELRPVFEAMADRGKKYLEG